MIKLYDYQQECVNSIDKNDKGIICLPTGTGKTFVQAAVIAMDILKNKNKFNMYVINAPRIILSFQLLKEVYSFLTISGIEARYMAVHSGGSVDIKDLEDIRVQCNADNGYGIKYSQIESGTSTETIEKAIEDSKKSKLPLVLFSTYNSAERIELARPTGKKISIIMNDEAQYLVQERFHDILHTLKSRRCYFFTATMITTPSNEGRGMNNADSYGKVIYQMSPREAIERGKMVRPRMHFVITKDTSIKYNTDDFQASLGHIIEECLFQHAYALRGINPKILVSVKGVGDIKKFFESKEYTKLLANGVDVYAVASDESIGNNINGNKTNRQDFLKKLKEDGNNISKRLIVMHYDILSEGIDISGFTGILPLRTLSKSKFLQTFGRAARLNVIDRKRLEDGEIRPNELDKFIKSYAWVIIPSIVHESADSQEHVGDLIEELRDYGFDPKEDIYVSDDDVNGLPSIDGPDALLLVKKKCPNIGRYIDKVEARYESERLARLKEEDIIGYLTEVVQDL